MAIDIRRVLIGKPLATDQFIHQRLSKLKALAVFSSDALSSSAYATEAILLVLVAAGAGALGLSWPLAIAISGLLIIVAFSYYQTIHAYPNGGGAYIVAKDNLGTMPGLIAAAALLIDYTLTVAVSVSAGVAALTSAFPEMGDLRLPLALIIVVFITVMNLRGVKESGTFFAIPTYAFILGMLLLITVGTVRVAMGNAPEFEQGLPVVAHGEAAASSAGHSAAPAGDEAGGDPLEAASTALTSLSLFLVLRAFAAGCTALTGVEAISNGIPAFKKPESVNAGQTLIVMVTVLVTMFVGITFLATHYPVTELGTNRTVLSQMSAAVFGSGTLLFFYLQFATLFILSLAANTAFADFPRLASLISADRFLPRQLTGLGDRLVYSNGIVSLSIAAGILIILFDAREHNLLPLYAVGVFISFTLSQSGMVRHWLKERHLADFRPTPGWYFHIFMNGFGALATFIVMLILIVTKFAEGAWLVIVAIPLFVWMFLQIHRHYLSVAASLTLEGIQPGPIVDTHRDRSNVPMVVLMNSLNRSSLQALEYALRLSRNVRVCSIEVDPAATERLKRRWREWGLDYIPLDVIESPYREIGRPLVRYLHRVDEETPEPEPTVVILPEFVVAHWWERFLHNQTSVAIREALYHDQIAGGRGRMVIDVPYRLGQGTRYYPASVDPQADTGSKSATNIAIRRISLDALDEVPAEAPPDA
jgi:amino acid transporter